MDNEEMGNTKEFNVEEIVIDALPKTEEISVVTSPKEEELEILTFDGKAKKKNVFKELIIKFKNLKPGIKVLILVAFVLILVATGILVWVLTKEKETGGEVIKDPVKIVVKDNYRYEDGKLFILDDNDKELGTYVCQNNDENKCYVAYTLNDDNFNVSQKEFGDGTKYQERTKVYHDRYVFIYDNKEVLEGVVILYDLKENKEIDSYIGVKHYDTENKDIIIIKNKENKYGLVALNSEGISVMLEYKYDYLGVLSSRVTDGVVVAKENNKWSLVTFDGKVQARNIDYEIKDYNDKFIVISNNNQLYIMDYTRDFITNDSFAHVELLDEYFLLVKDNKLMVKDAFLDKYNEEGITLFNDQYNKIQVFDEDGKQVATKFAYSYELVNNKLNFTISETEETTVAKTINLMEGKLSVKQNFYSYFDGVLYFYKDGDKTELIGQYTCVNTNSLTDSSTEFDKCYMAKDEITMDNDMVALVGAKGGVSAIFNERFVFIRDAEKLAEGDAKIKLYDIKSKKILASYVAINSLSKQNNESTYHVAVSKQAVIAKNKSGKMGVISINTDSVGALISFEYDVVEVLGNYFVVKKDGKWQIKESNTIDISGQFEEQIRGYGGVYLKTKVNGKYNVYSMNDTTAIGKGYNYAELGSKVFVAVDNSNVAKIYKYDGSLLNNETFALSGTNYYGVENRAFTLSEAGNEITITVSGKAPVSFNYLDGTRVE